MQIDLKQQGNEVRLVLKGDLDYTTQDAFESEVRRVIQRFSTVILDFGQIRFIDSSGVAALLTCCEDALQAGVAVRITQVADDLMEIFDLIGVRNVLPLEQIS